MDVPEFIRSGVVTGLRQLLEVSSRVQVIGVSPKPSKDEL